MNTLRKPDTMRLFLETTNGELWFDVPCEIDQGVDQDLVLARDYGALFENDTVVRRAYMSLPKKYLDDLGDKPENWKQLIKTRRPFEKKYKAGDTLCFDFKDGVIMTVEHES